MYSVTIYPFFAPQRRVFYVHVALPRKMRITMRFLNHATCYLNQTKTIAPKLTKQTLLEQHEKELTTHKR